MPHATSILQTPLIVATVDRFVGNHPRRCQEPGCNGAAIHIDPPAEEESVEDLLERRGHRRYQCATCGRDAKRPHGLHCPGSAARPDCNAWMREVDGQPMCHVCPPLVAAPATPRAGWEICLAEGDRNDHEALHRANDWGCIGIFQWDKYGKPAHLPSRLALRFGFTELDRFYPGSDDEQFERDDQWRTTRIAMLVSAVKVIALHGKSRTLPKKHHTLPREYRALARRAWPAYRRFLFEIAADIVNAIILRGGSFANITDFIRLKRPRSTPFAGYRHALRAATGEGDPEQEAPGRGSGSLAAAQSGVSYKHGLPGGILMQKEGPRISPSRNGASAASTSRGTREDDARSCYLASRWGGVWSSAVLGDDGIPAAGKAARVDGGRELTAVEEELLILCELGAEKGDTFDSLTKEQRARILKENPAALIRDYGTLTLRQALRQIQNHRRIKGAPLTYPEARHLQEGDALLMLNRARVATLEAFEAWGLIEKQPRKKRSGGGRGGGGAPVPDQSGSML